MECWWPEVNAGPSIIVSRPRDVLDPAETLPGAAPEDSCYDPRHRQLFMERQLTNPEQSAWGVQPLTRTDQDPHGVTFQPLFNVPGSSPGGGIPRPPLAAAPPLTRNASSSSSATTTTIQSIDGGPAATEYDAVPREHSWPINRRSYLCASPDLGSVPPSLLQSSPAQYPIEPYPPPQSPLIGAVNSLFVGDMPSSVEPQDVQLHPDFAADLFPAPSAPPWPENGTTPRSVPSSYPQPLAAPAAGWAAPPAPQQLDYSACDPPRFAADPVLDGPPRDPHPHPAYPERPGDTEPPRKRMGESQPTCPLTHAADVAPSPPTSSPSPPPPLLSSRTSPTGSSTTVAGTKTTKSPTPRSSQRGRGKRSAAGSRTRTSSAAHGRPATNGVEFPCTFAAYGCTSTFTAKNEWKRHVVTIHLQPSVYICNVGSCRQPVASPTTITIASSSSSSSPSSFTSDSNHSHPHPPPITLMSYPPSSPKTFNRKDLFAQHLRRKHGPPSAELDDTAIHRIAERCLVVRRELPARSHCPYCSRVFAGRGCWDDRQEHVAQHVETGHRPEREDVPLREWAVREGILVPSPSTGDGGKRWVLAASYGGRGRRG
ncbi:hypothetical protein VTO42DRAFT_3813 [Malbranchea cinnamomea]